MDRNIMDDLNSGCRQMNEQRPARHLEQRTLMGRLHNLHVNSRSPSRLMCCRLSRWLYFHALCTWEMWDAAQLSICAHSWKWLPASTCRGLHVNMLLKHVKLWAAHLHKFASLWLTTILQFCFFCFSFAPCLLLVLTLPWHFICQIVHNSL